MSLRSYTAALGEQGIVNPATEKPFSKNTLAADLTWVRKEYAKELASDSNLLDMVNDLMNLMELWREASPNSVIGGYKLLSDWLDMPNRLKQAMDNSDRRISISEDEYKEFMRMKAEEQNA